MEVASKTFLFGVCILKTVLKKFHMRKAFPGRRGKDIQKKSLLIIKFNLINNFVLSTGKLFFRKFAIISPYHHFQISMPPIASEIIINN